MSTRTSGVDAFTSGNIYTPNYKSVIAVKRELCVLLPVRLAPNSLSQDYQAGTILAQYSSAAGSLQNFFVNYVQSAASGQGTPVCILGEFTQNQLTSAAASTPLSWAIFSGIVFQTLLPNYDSTVIAASGLNGKIITAADGTALLKF